MKRFRALLATIAFVGLASVARAQETPSLQTNQSYVEELARPTALDVSDLMAVFGFVWAKLPERVKVYPTENYYYFGFFHRGIRYAGNIRLDASNRDDGKVVFAYFEDTAQWFEDAEVRYRVLDQTHGVSIEKVEPFLYRVSYQGKAVAFALNDLRGVKPPALGADEVYLGPIFDESAIQFYLLFNKRLKVFHYVLNESGTEPDQFFSPHKRERILEIGRA